jgi:hypothetical protein
MLKTITKSLLALTLVAGIGISSMQPAQAGRGGGIAAGVAVGTLLGLGIAGAYAGPRYYDDGPRCYRGPRQCERVGRSCYTNRFGETVCGGGEYRCWHPRICD